MPCGPQLIEAVEACIILNCRTPSDVYQFIKLDNPVSNRAIRYAITTLVKQGKVRRVNGTMHAVRAE